MSLCEQEPHFPVLSWVEPGVVFCRCSPAASKFEVLRFQRCFSWLEHVVIWVTISFPQLKAVWPFSFDFYQQDVFTQRISSFSDHSLNHRDDCVGNSQKICSYWNTQTSLLPTTMPPSKSLLLHLGARFELQEVIFNMSKCCHVIGSLDILLMCRRKGVPNKVASGCISC